MPPHKVVVPMIAKHLPGLVLQLSMLVEKAWTSFFQQHHRVHSDELVVQYDAHVATLLDPDDQHRLGCHRNKNTENMSGDENESMEQNV